MDCTLKKADIIKELNKRCRLCSTDYASGADKERDALRIRQDRAKALALLEIYLSHDDIQITFDRLAISDKVYYTAGQYEPTEIWGVLYYALVVKLRGCVYV